MFLTYIFIAITVVVSYMAFNQPSLLDKLMMQPRKIYHKKEYYRLITSGFIHAGWMHLLFNMITLYSFGRVVEMIYLSYFGTTAGWLYFAGLYLGGIVVSDLPNLNKYKDSSYFSSLGASGGVASVIFAMILYNPTGLIYLFFGLPLPSIIFGGLYLIYSSYYASGSSDGINHSAHLYGSLFGLAYTALTVPDVVPMFLSQLQNASFF
jgi:membrane associated rhomboid family serine protease